MDRGRGVDQALETVWHGEEGGRADGAESGYPASTSLEILKEFRFSPVAV